MIENVVIKAVEQTDKTWKNPQGKEFRVSNIELEDGRTGTTLSGKLAVGPMKLEVVEGQFGLNFKYVDEGYTPHGQMGAPMAPKSNETNELIVRQVAIKAAAELACAGMLEENKSLYQQADDIVDWVMKK